MFAVTTTFRNSDLNRMVLLWAAANRDSVLVDRDSRAVSPATQATGTTGRPCQTRTVMGT